jgi:hypothetical protein
MALGFAWYLQVNLLTKKINIAIIISNKIGACSIITFEGK